MEIERYYLWLRTNPHDHRVGDAAVAVQHYSPDPVKARMCSRLLDATVLLC